MNPDTVSLPPQMLLTSGRTGQGVYLSVSAFLGFIGKINLSWNSQNVVHRSPLSVLSMALNSDFWAPPLTIELELFRDTSRNLHFNMFLGYF